MSKNLEVQIRAKCGYSRKVQREKAALIPVLRALFHLLHLSELGGMKDKKIILHST